MRLLFYLGVLRRPVLYAFYRGCHTFVLVGLGNVWFHFVRGACVLPLLCVVVFDTFVSVVLHNLRCCVASARWPPAWVWVVWRFAWYPLQARLSCRRLGRVLASVAWCLLSWSLCAVGAVFREVAAVALRAFVLSSFSGVAVATCCQRRLGIAGCRCVLCERVVQLANARRSAALCSQRGPRLRSHSKARILRDG